MSLFRSSYVLSSIFYVYVEKKKKIDLKYKNLWTFYIKNDIKWFVKAVIIFS